MVLPKWKSRLSETNFCMVRACSILKEFTLILLYHFLRMFNDELRDGRQSYLYSE